MDKVSIRLQYYLNFKPRKFFFITLNFSGFITQLGVALDGKHTSDEAYGWEESHRHAFGCPR